MRTGPWDYNGQRIVRIRKGERLKLADPQHRTKGAKPARAYITSDRPDGLERPNGLNNPRKRGAAYGRRQARRAAMRNANLNGM